MKMFTEQLQSINHSISVMVVRQFRHRDELHTSGDEGTEMAELADKVKDYPLSSVPTKLWKQNGITFFKQRRLAILEVKRAAPNIGETAKIVSQIIESSTSETAKFAEQAEKSLRLQSKARLAQSNRSFFGETATTSNSEDFKKALAKRLNVKEEILTTEYLNDYISRHVNSKDFTRRLIKIGYAQLDVKY